MTAHCALNPDRMLYFVLCRYGSGLAWAERDADRMGYKNTIDDIQSGELPNVVQVIEVNVAEIISRDVTGDMIVEARGPEIRSKLLADLARQDHERELRRHA